MYRITVKFKEAWCLSARRDDYRRFTDVFLGTLGSRSVVECCSASECRFLVRCSPLEDVEKQLIPPLKAVCENYFGYPMAEGEIKAERVTLTDDLWKYLLDCSGGTLRGKDPFSSVEDRIERLVGADSLKALIQEISSVAPSMVAHRTYRAFTTRSYLFSVNNGCGYSTYLKLFADFVEKAGLFSFATGRRVVEEKLSSSMPNQGDPFDAIQNYLRRYGKEGGMLISIDISEWISSVNHPNFRRFLSMLEDYSPQNIFVFRVPFLDGEVLEDLRSVLADILYVRTVVFPPLSMDQLCLCAEQQLEASGFSLGEDAREIFSARVLEEKSDGRFYGINTVHKIVSEMIYRKHLHIAQSGEDDCLIRAAQIQGLAHGESAGGSGLDALEDMVGLEGVRRTVEEIVAQIEFSLRNGRERPSLHMRFVGNPGTGKTTVARILGRILKERGILRQGHFFEYNGRDFCGRYIGETAPKTTAMCRDAYGSVLFIDEAYTLYRGDDNQRDFGREALETLLAEMENHRKDLVVIMAGYPDEMDQLMKANPGLESRMPYLVEFPNYDREDLIAIFFRLVGDAYTYDDAFREAVVSYFNGLADDVLCAKSFSNGRFVRNLFERTCAKAGTRRGFDGEEPLSLTREDFLLAGADSAFRILVEKKPNKKIGF